MTSKYVPAELTDPEQGMNPPCPCHTYPRPSGTDKGWHERKGPAPLLRKRSGLPRGIRLAQWMDHTYRLRLEDGRWCYVAEPYEVTEEALADLLFLAENGYDIRILSWAARHYPGHTVAIQITPTP